MSEESAAPASAAEPAAPPSLIGDEPPAPAAGAPAAPAPFVDFTAEQAAALLPEGFTLDEPQTAKLVATINAAKGDPAALSRGLLKMYSEELSATQARLASEFNTLQERRQAEVRADPVIGGENLQASLKTANEVVKRYGSQELVKEIASVGLGNSLHLMRFLVNVAKAAPLEARPVNGAPAQPAKTLGQRLYPSSQQQ